jgi:hypothetical protein
VAGQIERHYGKSMMGKVARLQDPDAVIVLSAMQENDGRGRSGEGLATGVGIRLPRLNVEQHAKRLRKP